MLRRAALPTVLALVLGGCAGAGGGGEDFEGVELQVAEAIEELQTSASRQSTAGEVCRQRLSDELAERLADGGADCEQEIRRAIADADLFDLQVLDVTVRGDLARARVRTSVGDDTTVATFALVRQQGDWRVDAIQAD